MRRPAGRRMSLLALVALTGVLVAVVAAGAAPGTFTQAQIDKAVADGVSFIDTQQNADGSFGGGNFPEAETALAIISYGVLDGGHTDKLTADQQTHLKSAVGWLLTKQSADGSFGGFLGSYSTGLALLAFSYVKDQQAPGTDIDAAIAKGRRWLIMTQNAAPSITGNDGTDPNIPGPTPDCSTDPTVSSSQYCGGWNYNASFQRSDESNTGFALTGLVATGGVPVETAKINAGWQRNIQMVNTNPYSVASPRADGPANDGGGSYEPNITTSDFASNANNTGSLIFGLAYDGVPLADPAVTAAIRFGTDVLDEYELMKDQPGDASRSMVFHSTAEREGPCVIGDADCGWQSGKGEGGYHYSIFALSKGLGQYQPSSLTDPTNYYAKVVDLLLTEQSADGSWPFDPRDDGSILGATAFAIMSLGRVGQPPIASGTVYNDANGDGHRDAGDAGTDGWTVYLDSNGNSQLDSGEPSAVTAGGGGYSLQNLPEGKATIREVGQSGFTCTAPAGCAHADVPLELGTTATGLDFGNRRIPPPATPAATPPATQVLGVVKGVCGSSRLFKIHLRFRKSDPLKSAKVVVNGKKVKVKRRGRRLTAIVDLRSLKPGTYVVRIKGRTRSGKKITGKRTYHTCAHKQKPARPPKV